MKDQRINPRSIDISNLDEDSHHVKTILHLRDYIKTLQKKLGDCSLLLANILPHIESWASNPDAASSANYISFEIMEKYGDLVDKFKDEYNAEEKSGSVDDLPDGKL